MAIQDRNLTPGTRLVARYHKQHYGCEVVERDGGRLGYRLQDGWEFKSPSSAGTAITGKACNGWAFWGVETSPAQATPEAETVPTQEAAVEQSAEDTAVAPEPVSQSAEEPVVEGEAEAGTDTAAGQMQEADEEPALAPPPAKKRFSRVPNQRGVPEGQTRWYCFECGKSFVAPSDEPPVACPPTHPAA